MTRPGHLHVAGAIALVLHALAPVMILVIFGLRVAELVPFWLLAISTLPIMFVAARLGAVLERHGRY